MKQENFDSNLFVNDINSYYKLPVKSNADNEEEIWIKKLRSILNTDIHESSLGCRINDTHVKIGDIHMSSFFEARFMFSQQKWIIRFANWLKTKLNIENSEGIVIIGYETYLEPVLSYLKLNFTNKIEYCIYEVEKHLSANPKNKTDTRVRYLENIIQAGFKFNKVVFICGISSTLSTYEKMQEKFEKLSHFSKSNYIILNYALIQVLPESTKDVFIFVEDEKKKQTKIEWSCKNKTVIRYKKDNVKIKVNYLVDVFSEWQLAEKCKWCFTQEERPLITVDDTSVVPQQIITAFNDFNQNREKDKVNEDLENLKLQKNKIDFFDNEKNFTDCIYYKHIERGENHYQYYVRTAKLFWEIVHNKNLKETFIGFSNHIKTLLTSNNKPNFDNKHIINIIITPMHYSNVLFPSYINHFVFGGEAHIITVEPKKEYRSNFVTKYSNYAYLNEQYNKNVNIRYHYIDDQIVSGSTFYRTESLVRTLKNKFSADASDEDSVFFSTIILLNRISNESQKNYTQGNRFFSLIDLKISHIRNHGDACPLCKQAFELKDIAEKSALIATKNYWIDKAIYHEKQSLKNTKRYVENLDNIQKQMLNKRHFMRLKCENLLTETTDKYASDYTCLQNKLYETIRRALTDENNIIEKYELLISFVKALSRPFLYYSENVKKFTLKFLTELLNSLIYSEFNDEKIIINKENYYSLYNISLPTSNYFLEQYCLLCVILNQLSAINSNYLLHFNNIINIMLFVDKLKPKFEKEVKEKYDITGFGCHEYNKLNKKQIYTLYGICSIVANNFKRVICGISGEHKIRKIQKSLGKALFNLKTKVIQFNNVAYNEELHKLRIDVFRCIYVYNLKFNGKNINRDQELHDFVDDILYRIFKFNISENAKINTFKNYNINTRYRYIKIMSIYIYLLDLYYNRKKLFNNLSDIIEIIYFENCHTDSHEENTTIESLLATIMNENDDIVELKLCLNSDVDSSKNTYFLLEYTSKNYIHDFFVSTSKLSDLFEEENIEDNYILESINRKGFFYNKSKNKWLILLCKDSTSSEFDNKIDSYLYISLKDNINEERKLFSLLKKYIKNYRTKLTYCIDSGISNGSLYAKIKKYIANSILSSEKTQSHGKSQDLVNLYNLAKREMEKVIKLSNEENKIYAYTAINLLMNRLISIGAIKNTYETYFGVNNTDNPLCNTMQKVNEKSFDKVKDYFDYISGNRCKYINDIHALYAIKSGVSIGNSIVSCENINFENISYVPQLLSKLDLYCSEDSAIWLIGIIDIFIRNAIKHSPKVSNNEITVKGNNQIVHKEKLKNGKEKYIKCYSFTISNKRDKKVNDLGEIHLTNQFFMKYLPSIKSNDKNFFYVVKNKSANEYSLTINFRYTCD